MFQATKIQKNSLPDNAEIYIPSEPALGVLQFPECRLAMLVFTLEELGDQATVISPTIDVVR